MYCSAGIKQAPNVEGDFKQQIAHCYSIISDLDYNIGRLMHFSP